MRAPRRRRRKRLVQNILGISISLTATVIFIHIGANKPPTNAPAGGLVTGSSRFCERQGCLENNNFYWNFNETIQHEQGSSVTLVIDSIPSEHRLPLGAIKDVTTFLDQGGRPANQLLFEYNPSFVRLPTDQKIRSDAQYLATFRVSSQNYCFRPTDRKRIIQGNQKHRNYLGLAVLNSRLQMLENVVVEPSVFSRFEDFRLTRIGDQLYLSTFDEIAQVWLKNAPTNTNPMPRVFGDPNFLIHAQTYTSCAPCGRKRACGKNFNYFTNLNNNGSAMVEIWPSPPHQIRTVDLSIPCNRTPVPQSFVSDHDPGTSFVTIEQLYASEQRFLTRGRGSACCVEIEHNGKHLWLGIEHVKTQPGRKGVIASHYLSRWYVFGAKPPYNIIARSGLFCMGFSTESEEQTVPHARLTKWRHLRIGPNVRVPSCPRIHFVSGLGRDAVDSEKLIVSYGVNDCVSRFIRVSLKDVATLLFGPQSPRQNT